MQKSIGLKAVVYQKMLSIIISPSSMEKNLYEQSIDFDIKWYEKIKKINKRR